MGVAMTTRHEYWLGLAQFESQHQACPAGIQMRAVETTDVAPLADLMLDAYLGTIDYEGETLQDAIAEVQAYFDGKRGGEPLLDVSRVATQNGLVSACLVAGDRRKPLIAYVMTRASAKGQGLAKYVLVSVLRAMQEAGSVGVRAVITQGNAASERLFAGLGFRRMDA